MRRQELILAEQHLANKAKLGYSRSVLQCATVVSNVGADSNLRCPGYDAVFDPNDATCRLFVRSESGSA
jgi:hypothetical protein